MNGSYLVAAAAASIFATAVVWILGRYIYSLVNDLKRRHSLRFLRVDSVQANAGPDKG